MHDRHWPAIISMVLLLSYAVALRALPLMYQSAVQAQEGYPGPTTPDGAYPPPSTLPATRQPTPTRRPAQEEQPTNTPQPTVTRRPTNAPVRLSPTPTSTGTPSVVLTPTRQRTATPTQVAVQPTRRPSPTPAAPISLPPTATRPAPTEARPTPQQTAAPSPTSSPTATSTLPLQVAEASASRMANAPPANLLPPIAEGQSEPGTLPTLLAGLALAGLAWWFWGRWIVSGEPAGSENIEEER